MRCEGRVCTVFFLVPDLFEEQEEVDFVSANSAAPLATRMRPRSLEEFVGQEHILGPGKLLRRAIEADRLPSVIFSGPPGTGKTTLAHIIADMTHAKFVRLSGVESNVAEMRRVIAAAANRLRTSGQKTILFIDEIHHFNKAQQDVLLPDVESGNLRLIGATTYNPFFYVNSPLVSRSQVFQLEPLRVEQLEELIDRALADKERGLGNYEVKMDKNARRHLAKLSDGDARKCLNALEIGVLTTGPSGGKSAVSSKSSTDKVKNATESFTSPSLPPRKAFSKKRSSMIGPATRTTTRSAHLSKACALPTKKARCTGSRKCCMPVKTSVSSRDASLFLQAKTSVWPIRRRCHSRSRRSKPWNLSGCQKLEFPWRMPPVTCAVRQKAARLTTRSMPRPKRSKWNKRSASPSGSRTNISR